MIAWIEKLKERPTVHISVVYIYILFFMTMHVEVGGWLNSLFGDLDRKTYNSFVLVLAIMLSIIITLQGMQDWRKLKDVQNLRLVGVYTISAVLISYLVLMVINVEAVHFVQYAVFAILIFPYLKSYLSVVITCALVGALDEMNQYLYLDTRANYYDFNDIFFDTIGGGIGLMYLKVKGYKAALEARKWYTRTEWQIGGAISFFLVLLLITGNFSLVVNEENPAIFSLFKTVPSGFWTYPEGPYARFHILMPIPGLIMITLSCYVYGLMDKAPA